MYNTSAVTHPMISSQQIGRLMGNVKNSKNAKWAFLIGVGLLAAMLHPTFAAGFLLAVKVLQSFGYVIGLFI